VVQTQRYQYAPALRPRRYRSKLKPGPSPGTGAAPQSRYAREAPRGDRGDLRV